MYELIKVAENTFYMDCPTKVGFYKIEENDVVLIDSGSDKDAAKKVKRILDEQGWNLTAIFNTHSHADHIGGNQYLQNQTGCKIYAPGMESAITSYPLLEPCMLFGGFPSNEMRNKFLMAKESNVQLLEDASMPEGLEIINLPGHAPSMVGFKTKDNVIFLADSLSSKETLEKYKINYTFDVATYLETLEKIKTLEADMFVPAHAPASNNISDLAQINIDSTLEIIKTLKSYLSSPICFDDLLAKVFEGYGLDMNIGQHLLVGSTVRSFLAYLKNQGEVTYTFENNKLLWQLV